MAPLRGCAGYGVADLDATDAPWNARAWEVQHQGRGNEKKIKKQGRRTKRKTEKMTVEVREKNGCINETPG